jgi:hypothetical protein
MFTFRQSVGISRKGERIPSDLHFAPIKFPDYDSMAPERASQLILENQISSCTKSLERYTLMINEAAFHNSKGKIKRVVNELKDDFYIWQEPSARLLEGERTKFIAQRKGLVAPFLASLEGIVKTYRLDKQLQAMHSYQSAINNIQ